MMLIGYRLYVNLSVVLTANLAGEDPAAIRDPKAIASLHDRILPPQFSHSGAK
jgi:hypothetical protein